EADGSVDDQWQVRPPPRLLPANASFGHVTPPGVLLWKSDFGRQFGGGIQPGVQPPVGAPSVDCHWSTQREEFPGVPPRRNGRARRLALAADGRSPPPGSGPSGSPSVPSDAVIAAFDSI